MKTEIIAEIGVNANGDIKEALALIDGAIEAGADCVKFQAVYPRLEMSYRLMPDRIEQTEKVILSHTQIAECVAYCKRQNIDYLCTPSEIQSLHWMIHTIEPRRIKIGSDNLTNHPMLHLAASYDIPIIISTGMATMREVVDAYDFVLREYLPAEKITVLHCTSSYPCALADANLRAIKSLQSMFPNSAIGWSDHTTSATLAGAAVAMGATMIEAHITSNCAAPGPDHATSKNVLEFTRMVRIIREAEIALGDGEKKPRTCELQNRELTRKSIVAKTDIARGDKFDAHNIAIMRPGFGRQPREWTRTLGKIADRSYGAGEIII